MKRFPPDWAVRWGVDEQGRFADLALGRITQRMRWIPPGTFMMGSPETEPGRPTAEERKEYEGWGDEGPQHEVELTQGFWLADTPVTQALWQAVMGENPSHFQHPQRPVEQVSWEEAQAFIAQLSEQLPGPPLRLPSEAEWEYACRANTTTATWAGPMQILGESHAPVLDDIAWYGGNSGVDYDLEEGVNSKGWPEKQHPHERAGARVVGQKRANPFGLHDMLGNVLEWCQDAYAPYAELARTDPVNEMGSGRVIRGGSWYDFARFVRAASRYAYAPSLRFNLLGFRLARGPQAQKPEAPGRSPSDERGAFGSGRDACDRRGR